MQPSLRLAASLLALSLPVPAARNRLIKQARRRDVSETALQQLSTALDPRVLTIGFARRFAPYKRADLICRDLPMLEKLVTSSDRNRAACDAT